MAVDRDSPIDFLRLTRDWRMCAICKGHTAGQTLMASLALLLPCGPVFVAEALLAVGLHASYASAYGDLLHLPLIGTPQNLSGCPVGPRNSQSDRKSLLQ